MASLPSGPDSLESLRTKCENSRKELDIQKIRGMQFLPKSINMWMDQYLYPSKDYVGNVIPLTGKIIESLLIAPRYGSDPQIEKNFIKKFVILGDALFLPEFLAPFLVTCEAGTFLNIFPHTYVVPSNDPLHRQTSVGFVQIIDKSQNAFTIGSLLSNHELFFELLILQPDCISINIGLSDVKLENVSWNFSQIPNEFIKMIQDLIANLQHYFFNAGSRGAFAENLTYTLNLLPMYAALDSEDHNVQNVFQAVCHTNLWGTTYYNITRKEYKLLADAINKKLHKGAEVFFDKYQLILLNPTPRWTLDGLHVDKRTGLPNPEVHSEMLKNFFYALARVACTRRICTLGINSSRNNRHTDKQLTDGCAVLFKKAFDNKM